MSGTGSDRVQCPLLAMDSTDGCNTLGAFAGARSVADPLKSPAMVPKMIPSGTHAHAQSTAASALFLNWRTRHRAVRAEHAAVARLRSKQTVAVSTLVEKLARIGRHDLPYGDAALRAGQHGFEHHTHRGDFTASIRVSSPLVISRSRSSAPPIRTPLTNTIGNVGQPVHIFRLLRRRQSLK